MTENISNITSEKHKELEQSQSDDKVAFGFWVYLMTDLLMFAALFATFAVLRNNTFGGPSGHELFKLPSVLIETLILLTSSFTTGLAILAVRAADKKQTLIFLTFTFFLGLIFLAMEITEFRNLVSEGNSWTKSGFLSSFFTLVGTHGLHILAGLIWLAILIFNLLRGGFNRGISRKLTLFSLFWHFLDIVWIFIFTIVYLMA